MSDQRIHRASGKVMIGLSVIALVTVMTGYAQQPQPDEGTGAHIFQLSIVLLLPTIVVFVATADWRDPSRPARLLALSAMALVLAFSALYYLEHYWWPAATATGGLRG